MLTFHAIADWPRQRVRIEWADRSSRELVPEVERIIEQTWSRVVSRPGVHLFDGPMCRLESFDAAADALRLVLSATSYKAFVGTNLENARLAEQFGPGVMANPVGVSTLVETADGHLLLGRRNASVAYYPDRVHPFAGALEPRDGADAFAAVCRELREELSLAPDEISDLRCCGLVEDRALRQPELIFLAASALSRHVVEARLDRVEHHACWSSPHTEAELSASLNQPALTPVAVASLLLAGRARYGHLWFRGAAAPFCGHAV